MIYQVRFKPYAIKDGQKIPRKDMESVFEKMKRELEDYEDLKLLRQAKRKEDKAATLTMEEAREKLLKKRSGTRKKESSSE
jgi:mRNA-degrading endonuclease RelE of RelBE toxin-antitoxin system